MTRRLTQLGSPLGEAFMFTRRLLLCVLASVAAASAASAQEVNLVEAPLAQRSFRNELTMELAGKITIRQGDKEASYPHKAQAKHLYLERYLDVNAGIADRAARHYLAAEGTITFNNNESSKRTLRAERKFMVAHRLKDQFVAYSPHGPMTRTEMELCEHFDTLAIPGLLPGKTIAVGKSWAIPHHVVAALCELDGVQEHNLEGKLDSVKGNLAQITFVGQAKGINVGAPVTMLINAELAFDVKAQCIVALQWRESDSRKQGPVSPTLDADVTIKLARTPIEEPEQLNKFALVPIPDGAPAASLTNLRYQDGAKRFAMTHARNWHVVSPDDNPQLVMRLLDRGEFVAQATLTPWKKTDPKAAMSLNDFAELMQKTPGWAEEKVIESELLKDTPKGRHAVYRVVASGALDGVRTVQYFYLLIGSNGEQLIVTYSVIPQQVQRLGARDLEMVREIVFAEK
jgi:hypothetical protein